ncbi:MAG TPA: FlgO family outer membrane protein, partial [Thermoanaerobaculia bacterium]|nr:FlgO family outer membrane protein [Thermoanaerobaculia bacterium]
MNATAPLDEKRIYRFDELLADPVRRVLLRDGQAVPVTPKALSILFVLLERPGEVVTKEELIRQVWAGSHVSEANLTQNVSSLRKALGERAGDRRYVVTVPGQGYSFAAPVELVDEEEAWPPVPVAVLAPRPVPMPAEPLVRRRPRIVLGLVSLAVVLALSFAISWIARVRLAPAENLAPIAPPSRSPSVAVLGFLDLSKVRDTGWLGTALTEMLATELAAGTGARVVPAQDVDRARRFVEIEPSGNLASSSLESVRSIVGADRVVAGTYVVLPEKEGRRIRIDVRVIRGNDGDVVASLAEVGDEAELFDLVARAGARLRGVLGYVAPSPEQAKSARALQPSDPEALRLYSLGLERMRSYETVSALEVLQRAAEVDPRSAAIRAALSEALEGLGHDARAKEEARKAVELAAGATREERLGLEARLQALEREWARASDTYRSLWTFYPENLDYGMQLATVLMRAGRGPEAMEMVAALRRLPAPLRDDPRIDLLEANIAGRIADRATERRASAAAMAKGRRSGEGLIVAGALLSQANALRAEGQIEPAVAAYREARRIAGADGHPYLLGQALAGLGFSLQARGDLAEAEEVHREALAIAERLGSSVGMAAQLLLLGRLHFQKGELTEASELLGRSLTLQEENGDRLNEARTLDSIGQVLLAQGDLDGARERLERALEINRALRRVGDEAAVLSHLGQVLERQGALSEALRSYEQAFTAFRQTGDRERAAEALAESASALSRLGRLREARRRLERALHAYRLLGNRLSMAEVLDRMSGLDYRTGDLAASRRLGEQELRIARETGSPLLLREALRRIGRADWAMDRPAEARQSFERALSSAVAAGEEAEAVGIRLDLARLALSDDRHGEAARLTREAADWYRERGMIGNEAQALSLLAEALLDEGRLAAAQETAVRARAAAGRSEDVEMRLLVATRLARVEAAAGRYNAGILELRQRISPAREAGYVNATLQ